ncbi:3-oxoacyl-ACP synthase [Pseudidiomarina aquimaris]|uniref:3-oxoacyl-ACP synthase n=1 Tax=Pseudidiomarina aquimaris TaxID=641841 RepID=A0A432XDJ0_9GAMM|nr:ketoacyl-ACP synthase III [Pseudidiomarina aquimaris]RUO46617.1 3-oxoacyl-ACP synthase [Pseudidiomarina aquimaris]
MNRVAKIEKIASYFPQTVLTNEHLSEVFSDWTADKIYSKTGIENRYIADENETALDLACHAAERLFSEHQVSHESIDYVIFCTQAPDYFLPTSACIIQDRLNINRSAGAVDINLGCSGFVYGLSLAKGLIESGQVNNVLLLTADTYTKFIHPMDKSVRTLFGDGAAATLISACNSDCPRISNFVFGTDGSGAKDLIVPVGGMRQPIRTEKDYEEVTDSSGNIRTQCNLFMNGANVLNFTLREVPKALDQILKKSGRDKEDYKFFVLHQANKFMLEALSKKLKVPKEKVPILMEDGGNTVSSTIPMALERMFDGKMLEPGDEVVFLGFGVGLSWAGCTVTI